MKLLDGGTAVAPGSREANDRLRNWLRREGDHGVAPRTVLHYAYPLGHADPRSRETIVRELQKRGFDVGDASLRGGCVFRHQAIVASDGFDETTAEIARLLASFDWEYDAWECSPLAASASVRRRGSRELPSG